MAELKKTNKSITDLASICHAAFAIIGTQVIENPDKDSVRVYSVYASALNLLTNHVAKWTYTRKKLSLLEKVKKAAAGKATMLKQLSQLTVHVVEQLRVLSNSLLELSKKYDNLQAVIRSEESNKVQSLHDIATFLSRQADILEKTADSVKVEQEQAQEPKVEGAGEAIYQRKVDLLHHVPDGYHKIGKHIGGLESTQELKVKALRLQNLCDDLASGRADDPSYYGDVFLPTLEKISGPPSELIRKVRQTPQEWLNELIAAQNPQSSLQSALTRCLDTLQQLATYYGDRTATKLGSRKDQLVQLTDNAVHVAPIGKLKAQKAEFTAAGMSRLIQMLLEHIDEVDRQAVKKAVQSEIKSAGKDTAEDVALLLSEPQWATHRQHAKTEIRSICRKIEDALEGNTDIKCDHIPHVAPTLVSDAADMPQLCSLAKYELQMLFCVLPYYHQLERHHNVLAALFDKLASKIKLMIDPQNKLTCIRRTGLLASTLVRCHLEQDESACQRLNEAYPLPIASKKWYTRKRGLDRDILGTLLRTYVDPSNLV